MKRTGILCVLFLFGLNLGFGQTNTQIENAAAFARLYGYVRFFHPSDEAAGLDWDRFAIYGARQVAGCKNARELQATLTALFQPIAPTVRIYAANQRPSINRAQLTPADTAGYRVVAWQHVGVGIGEYSNRYKSARTNRSTIYKVTDNEFGPVSASLPAAAYRNKEFIFRARVKMGAGTGTGHLWVRVVKPDKKPGFFDKMQNRPIRSKEWQDYEIKGTVDQEAQQILIGAILNKTGELWLDNLSLQIKEGDTWKEVYGESFEGEQVGKMPKGLKVGPLSYKYQVMSLAGARSGKFLSIKKDIPVITVPPAMLFKQHAQVGEYADKDIGTGLRVMLPLALYGTKEQTYPAADKTRLNELVKALAAILAEEIKGKDLYVRLAGVAITWNVFQHFYPYFDVAKTNWSEDLRLAVKSAYADQSEADFQKTLQKLTAKLKDGHVRVSWLSVNANFSVPITWEWIENQLVITNVFDKSLPIKAGDVVININGGNPKHYFDEVHQYLSAATKGYLDYLARHESLLGEQGSWVVIKVKKADKSTGEITLKRELPIYKVLSTVSQPDSIKQLSESIMYINVSTASMGAIQKVMPQLQQSKAIICDLRGYPNGNHKFIDYLLVQDDTSSQWMQVPHIIYPDQEHIVGYRKSNWGIKARKPHLTAKIIFIIDGRAISYAESYMSFIEHYKLATIVGQPTAGTNGNVNTFNLPGGYQVRWTGMKVLKHDGSRHHGVGILPDVYVNRTIKGVRENRDEFLEKALEIANQ